MKKIYKLTLSVVLCLGCLFMVASPTLLRAQCTVSIAGGTTFCGFGILDAVATGGAAPYFYTWNDASDQPSLFVLTSGTYSVTISDQVGCTASAAVNVVVNPQPTVNIDENPTGVICGAANVVLTATPTGGAGGQVNPFNYNVTQIANTFRPCGPNNGPTGDDAVTGPNNIGFNFVFGGVTYTQFGISTNGNIQLGAGGYTAAYVNGPMPNATFTLPTIAIAWDDMFADAGDITWGVSGTPGSRVLVICFNNLAHLGGVGQGNIGQGQIVLYEGTNVVEIMCNTTNNFVTATQGFQFNNANGQTIRNGNWGSNNGRRLTPPTGYTYAWSTGASTQQITVNQAGTYSVTLTDANGCTAEATSNVQIFPGLTAAIVNVGGTCGIAQLEANPGAGNGGVTYLWNNGTTDSLFTAVGSGTYSVTLTDVVGCTASATVNLNIGTPAAVTVVQNPLSPACGVNQVTLTAQATGGAGGNANGAVYYLRSNGGEPWGQATNSNAMNAVFGAGNWQGVFFQTANPATVFSPATRFVYIDGSDGGALAMNTFVTANIAAIQNWVSAGGRLLMNSAPNQGGNMAWGFGGVTLNYNQAQGSVNAAAGQAAHPVFLGPFLPCGTGAFTGNSWSHAHITGGGVTPLVTGGAVNPVAFLNFGSGRVIFGGMTTTNFHAPQPNATNLRQNMLHFLGNTNFVSYTYLWNTGATTQNITANTPGNYVVTISDGNGCSAVDTINIQFFPGITAAITGQAAPCAPTAQLTGVVTGGAAPFSYSWTGAGQTGNTQIFTVNQTGTYTLVVLDGNGCTATATTQVTISPPPTIVVAQNPVNPLCGNQNITLTANVPGGGGNNPFAYTVATVPNVFRPCGANPGPTGDDATNGPHNIGFTFNFGGVNYTQFGISTNGNIQLGGGGYTATFGNGVMPNAGFPLPTIAIAWDDMFADAGDITWGVSGTPGNRVLVVCFNNFAHLGGVGQGNISQGQIVLYEGTNIVDIMCNTTNNFASATQGFQFNNANGQTIRNGNWGSTDGRRISPPQAYTYNWNNGATTQTITVTQTGQYIITVTDVNGCANTDTVDIVVYPALAANITFPPQGACGLANVDLTANVTGGTGAITYIWTGGATTQVVNVAQNGQYILVATDSVGCTGRDTVLVNLANPPTVNITQNPPPGACGAATYTLTANANGGGGGAPGNGQAYYLRTQAGEPWGHQSNPQAMNAVFGAGNWQQRFFETAVAATIFNNGTRSVFMDGSDGGACEMNTFVSANIALIESWVNGGGRLYMNSAPNECANMNWGFGGVVLDYTPAFLIGNGTYTVPGHPIMLGPFLPTQTNFTGNFFVHSYIVNGGTTLCTAGGQPVLTEKTWGTGLVYFGGHTTPPWHTPAAPSQNIRQNILSRLANAVLVTYNYQWNTGATTQAITVNTPGTYIVTLTDGNGCSATDTLVLNFNPAVAVNITIPPGGNCGAVTLDLTANATGGTGSFAYLWTGGATTQVLTVTQSGTYAVTVTDDVGCTAADTITINLVPPPAVVITQNPQGVICGGNVTLTAANPNGGGPGNNPFAYTVTTIPNTFRPCGGNPGPVGDDAVNGPHNMGFNFVYGGVTYTQFGISTNGNIQLGGGGYTATFGNGPMPNVGFPLPTIALCWDDMFADPGDITWGVTGTPGNRVLVVCFNNFTHLGGAGAGNFSQAQIVLYEGTNVIEIMGITTNNIATGTQGFQFNNANGQTIQNGNWAMNTGRRITPPTPFTFTWNNGATTNVITVNQTGTYIVTITDPNGCTASDTVNLLFNPALTVNITNPPGGACGAATLDLTANGVGGTGAITYLWNPGGITTQLLTVVQNGQYIVVATDALGCTAGDTINVTLSPPPVVDITANPPAGQCGVAQYTLTANANGGGGGGPGNGQAYYIRSQGGGEPWGHQSNPQAMNAVFGAGNWQQRFFETAVAATIFNNGTRSVFMDGSDAGACEMNTFVNANIALIESWVNAGGRLYMNSAPNECSNMNWGFGGVVLDYTPPHLIGNGTYTVPGHPIMLGPFLPTQTNFTGNFFVHAYIANGGTTLCTAGGQPVLTEKTWGSGLVYFGGHTTPPWHTPAAPSQNIRQNILSRLANAVLVTYTYQWNTGATTQAITINTPGTYYVTVTDGNGCTALDSIVMNFAPALTVNITTPPGGACGAATVDLTATPTGGTGAVTYAWTGGLTTQVITVGVNGQYIVTATDAVGCTALDTFQVTLAPPPTVTITQTQANPCGPINVVLTANAVGGAGGANPNGQVYYMRSNAGNPWGSTSNETAMNAVFGAANWTTIFFQTANPATIFSPATRFIYIDGSDNGATAMNTFVTANITAMQNWVNAGGRLVMNSAPNQGGNMAWGFGGVTLNYNNAQGTVNAAAGQAGNPIFAGPFTPCGTGAFTGGSFSHAHVTGAGIVPLITGGAFNVLAQLNFGAGRVLFGGMTTTNFHNPQPNANNLRQNILHYAANNQLVTYTYTWGPGGQTTNQVTITQNGTYTVTVADGNGCTASATVTVNAGDVTPPVINCPQNITVTAPQGQCNAVVTYTPPTATDNCAQNCNVPLAQVLANFNANAAAIRAPIPNGYNFAMDGAGGVNANNIGDGGNDMYDGGNILNTVGQANIQYVDNVITNNAAAFGAGGNYFTRYNTGVPAMFFMAANINNIPSFFTTGNLGADGSGLTTGFTFPITVGTCNYFCFFRRVYQAGDPSINQLIIVNAAGGTQTFPNNTNDGLHRVDGINNATRLYYFLWGGANGFNYTDAQVQAYAQNLLQQIGAQGQQGTVTTALTAGLPSGAAFPVGTTNVVWTATDAAGNTATCSFNVTVNPSLVATATNGGPYCIGATIQLNATGGSTYAWSGPNGFISTDQNPTIPGATAAMAGVYTVTVTGIGGCTATAATTVQLGGQGVLPTAANGGPYCPGATIQLNATGGTVFAWSGPNGFISNLQTPTIAGATLAMAGTYTVTVSDAGGCSGVATTNVIISDSIAPVIVCPADTTVSTELGFCTATVNFAAATATDNCSTPTITYDIAPGTVFALGTTTVTATATDGAGNTATCAFVVTVVDNEFPILTCPANITLATDPGQCTAIVNFSATVTDNCSFPTITYDVAPGSPFPIGTTTVTATAADDNGNVTTCSFEVTIGDVEAPAIACPVNITQQADSGQCTGTVTFQATAADNCGNATITYSQNPGTVFQPGVTTVTVTATDTFGNVSTCAFDVTIFDNEAPAIACPADTTITVDAGQCTATLNFAAAATDNCGVPTVTYDVTPGSPLFLGATVVTATATDLGGNISTCSFTITVVDTEVPSITCPGNISVGADLGQCTAVVPFSVTALDNCGVPTVTYDVQPGSTFAIGTTVVTATAIDANGNTAACTFEVTVSDQEAPAIACPTNISVGTDAGQCTAVVNFAATATDNCGTPTVTYDVQPGSVFAIGLTTVTVTAVDSAGNISTCTFSVAVSDLEAPTLVCPANITVSSDSGQCTAIVTYQETASDNCGLPTLVYSQASGTAFPLGTTTVTITALDLVGNSTTCSFTVTVSDGTAPTLLCPGNISVGTDLGQCTAVVPFSATALDNCGVPTITYNVQPGSTFAIGTTVVTATAIDANGNTAACTFEVTVSDQEAPAIVCPANISVGTDAGQCTAVVNFNVTATDNCGTPTLTFSTAPGTAFAIGTTTVTATAVDAVGNTTTCSFSVTVSDTEGPAIACPANIITTTAPGQCDRALIFAATATDNCGTATLTYSHQPGTSFPLGTTVVTVSAVDNVGNTSSCAFNIVVNDAQPPAVLCPPNLLVALQAAYTLPNFSAQTTVTENCGPFTLTQSPAAGTVYNGSQLINVVMTATDLAGNTGSCSFTVNLSVNLCGYIYVDSAAVGLNNGTSWVNAYRRFEDALADATPFCDTILVARGTYRPGNLSSSTYNLKPYVPIYGGFPTGGGTFAQRNPNLHRSVFDGANVNTKLVTGVNLGFDPVLSIFDGFWIIRSLSGGFSGGMSLVSDGVGNQTSLIVRNCVFAHNVASQGSGVGVSASNGAQTNPQFINCLFHNNRATAQGGGLYLSTLNDATMNVQVTNCQFTQNQGFNPGVTAARAAGIGAYAFGTNSSITLNVTNSIFTGNNAEQWGGAIWNYARQGSACTVNIIGSTFNNNIANSGAAIHSHAQGGPVTCNVTNSTFTGNQASYMGGAVRNYCELAGGNGLLTMTGCTMTNNTATLGGGGIANVSLRSSVATVNVTRSFFVNNSGQRGGAYYNSSSLLSVQTPGTDAIGNFTNCSFWSNDGITTGNNIGQGGAVFQTTVSSAPATTNFMNCSFNANAAQQGSVVFNNAGVSTPPSPSVLRFTNSVFVGNVAPAAGRTFQSAGTAGTILVSFSLLDNATFAGNHTGNGIFTNGGSNISTAVGAGAVFANPATGDLHLVAGALAINTGTLVNAPLIDFDGDGRPFGQGIDMGCDEYTGVLRPLARGQAPVAEPFDATLFPNPNAGQFTVTFNQPLSGTLQVFDLSGRLVQTKGLFEANQIELDMASEASGLYLVRIVSGDQIITRKVTVKKP